MDKIERSILLDTIRAVRIWSTIVLIHANYALTLLAVSGDELIDFMYS